MTKMFSSRKAQNLTELALLIGVVAIVFIGMEVYFKRGLQSKVKNMTDNYMTSDALGGGNLVDMAKQEVYEIDTHNFVVQKSQSAIQSKGTVTAQTLFGGSRVDSSLVDTKVISSSTSKVSEEKNAKP